MTTIIIWAFKPLIREHLMPKLKPASPLPPKYTTYIKKGDAEAQIVYLNTKRANKEAILGKEQDSWAFLEEVGKKVETFASEEVDQLYQLGSDLRAQGIRYEHQ